MSLLNEIKRLTKIYAIKPKKRLGQSFCTDEFLLKRMIKYAEVGSDDIILEVGGGFGHLTCMISEKAKKVITIEIDPKLVKALKDRLSDRENVEIIEGDVLKVPLPKFNKIVANPPYSISSPLIFKLLKNEFQLGVMTFQREFAERIVAEKGSKDYGRLTVMAYYKMDATILEYVPESAFYPSPKIESILIQMKPRKKPFDVLNEDFFNELVRTLFTQRNRKVRNALTTLVHKKLDVNKEEARVLIEDLPYLERRVYKLGPEDFGLLSNEVCQRVYEGKRISFREHVFYVLPEVYEPSDDTFLMADHLNIHEEDKILDMGTGCGILGIIAAEKAGGIVAIDINPHAINCARKNAKINGVANKMDIRQGDLFQPIKKNEKFDLIIFNPPYLPTGLREGEKWLEKSWSGGPMGRTVTDRFLRTAPKYLKKYGRILMVQSTLSDVKRTLDILKELELKTEILAERKLEFESIVLINARKTT